MIHGPLCIPSILLGMLTLAPRADISIWENETDMRDFQYQSQLSTRFFTTYSFLQCIDNSTIILALGK